jgi:hypothetical protein
MAISETAKLIASLELKDLFTKQVDAASKSLGKLDKSLDSSQSRAYKAGAQIGTGIKRGAAIAVAGIGILATQVALGVKSLEDVEKVTAQTNAVLKSTHDVSKQTADGIRAMSNEFESLNATMDDTAIQAGANVLLTFTNIREKAFKPALQAALDLSTAMGTDLSQAALQVGKALNDPVKGIGALRRAGVQLTTQQVAQIKALVKSNDVLGAQKIILGELNKEFGGSFLAQGNTTAGKIAKVKDAIDDLQRALATALLPALGKIADATSKFLTRPEVVAGVQKLGQEIAGLFSDQNLAEGAKVLEGMFQTVKDLAPIVEASAKATFGLVQAAVGLFKSLPPEIQSLAVGAFAINKLTGGLVTNVAGGIVSGVAGLLGKTRGSSPGNPVFVSDISGGLPGGKGPAGKFGGILQNISLAALIPVVAVAVSDALNTFFPGNPATGGPPILNGPLPTKPIIDLGSLHLPFFGGPSSPPLPVTLVDHAGSPILDRGGRESGVRAPIFLPGDTRSEGRATGPASVQSTLTRAISLLMAQGGLQKAFILSLHGEFRDAFKLLAKANSAQQIKDAIKAINKITFDKGIGGSGGAAATEKTLKGLLIKFPSLANILVPEIRKVHAKMLGRQFEEAEFRKFDRINKSNLDNGKKVAELQKIAKDVGAKDRANGARLQAKVDALKATIAHGAKQTTEAIKDKDLSVRVTIPVSNRVVVNARTVQAQAAVFTRVFGGSQTAKNPGGGIGF